MNVFTTINQHLRLYEVFLLCRAWCSIRCEEPAFQFAKIEVVQTFALLFHLHRFTSAYARTARSWRRTTKLVKVRKYDAMTLIDMSLCNC